MNQIDERRFTIQLTDAQKVKILGYNPKKDLFDIGRDAIGCEWIELANPEPLARDGMLLIVDEEEKLRNDAAFTNCIASYLYGAERHGDLIMGHAVVVKSNNDGLELLTAAEAKQLASRLEQLCQIEIEKIAEAFGLRPVHQKKTEIAQTTLRQPCKRKNMER